MGPLMKGTLVLKARWLRLPQIASSDSSRQGEIGAHGGGWSVPREVTEERPAGRCPLRQTPGEPKTSVGLLLCSQKLRDCWASAPRLGHGRVE